MAKFGHSRFTRIDSTMIYRPRHAPWQSPIPHPDLSGSAAPIRRAAIGRMPPQTLRFTVHGRLQIQALWRTPSSHGSPVG
jgi:hypothetical protein